MNDVTEFLFDVVLAGGTSAALVFLGLRYFATSWMETKFHQKLEAFRHENAKELQSFNAEVEGRLQKTVQAQKLEAEAVAELWKLLNISYCGIMDLVARFQSIPDIKLLSEPVLREHLAQYDMLEAEKDEILSAPDRQGRF